MPQKYTIGIDLGGTMIKGGIVDNNGNVATSFSIPTKADKGPQVVKERICLLINQLLKNAGLTNNDIKGIGIGIPGSIDSVLGKVVYSVNLHWENAEVVSEIENKTGIKVKIINDAKAATLSEAKYGEGKGYNNFVMLTIGTGIGSGVIIDGKLYKGNKPASTELGHMIIVAGGEKCSCGLSGCFETYASSAALKRETIKAMLENKDSRMWEVGSIENVGGRTAFEYEKVDKTASQVVEKYMSYLSVGIMNIVNIFRPERIIIGGGISERKSRITKPLNKSIKENFSNIGFNCSVVTAKNKNKAGILGAAALFIDD